MSDFEGREREPGIDEQPNRPDERNAPPRSESEESAKTRPTPENQESPGEGASRSGQRENKPTGEDVDSGNE